MILRKNTRTWFYPVGLVSLMFIPLSYFLAVYKSNPTNERLFSLRLEHPSNSCDPSDLSYLYSIDYADVYLTTNQFKNVVELEYGLSMIRKLNHLKSSKGVRVILNDSMKFESVLSVFDRFKTEGIEHYYLVGNDICILGPAAKQAYRNDLETIWF